MSKITASVPTSVTLNTATRWGMTSIDNELFISKYGTNSYSIEVFDSTTNVLKRTITTSDITPNAYGSLGTDGTNLLVGNNSNQIVKIDKNNGNTISTNTTITINFKQTGTFHIDLNKDIIVYFEYSTTTNNLIIKRYSSGNTLKTYSLPTNGNGAGATILYGKYIVTSSYASKKVLISSDISSGIENLTFTELTTSVDLLGGLATYESNVFFIGYSTSKLYKIELTGVYEINNKILLLSNGETYSFQKGEVLTTNAIPNMTSNTVPSGVASSTNSNGTDFAPWKAFDNINSTLWNSLNAQFPLTLSYEFNENKMIGAYSLYTSLLTEAPKDWIFQGTNDDVNWVDLDKRSGVILNTSGDNMFEIASSGSFKKYRLYITANGGSNKVRVSSFKMYESSPLKINRIPSHSEQNLIKYGIDSPIQVDKILTNKNYILQDSISENEDGLLTTKINRKPLSIKFN